MLPLSVSPVRVVQVKRYNSILRRFVEAGSDEWDAIVSHHRGELQRPFFEHMQVGSAAQRMGYSSSIGQHSSGVALSTCRWAWLRRWVW